MLVSRAVMCWIDDGRKVVKVASDERPIDFQYPTVENISCEEQCVEKPKSLIHC